MSKFTVESWIWYSVAMCVVLARYASRIWHFRSVRKLKVEDWFMGFIVGLYTVLIAFLNVDHDVSTNLINPAFPIDLTPQEIRTRTWGSKTVLLVEQCMCAVQWGGKGCLLILYWRLTQNLRQHLWVKLAATYCIVTYCVMFILYFGVWCRPFHDYWEVPTDNTQCTTALHHLITNLCFNLTSDLLIIAIPLPMLLRQKLEFKKKILMVFPFSLGFFSMACAIASKVSSFKDPYSVEWVYWYCREASTIIIVTNMPYAWGLIRKVFKLRSFFHDSNMERTTQSGNMQHLDGQSIPRSEAMRTTHNSHRSSWPFSRGGFIPSKKRHSTQRESNAPVGADFGPASTADREVGKETLDPSSSDNSFAGSLRKPGRPANAVDAVDRLYDLDAIEDEESLHRDEHTLQRGYDG
jgi:hypothetical protein